MVSMQKTLVQTDHPSLIYYPKHDDLEPCALAGSLKYKQPCDFYIINKFLYAIGTSSQVGLA